MTRDYAWNYVKGCLNFEFYLFFNVPNLTACGYTKVSFMSAPFSLETSHLYIPMSSNVRSLTIKSPLGRIYSRNNSNLKFQFDYAGDQCAFLPCTFPPARAPRPLAPSTGCGGDRPLPGRPGGRPCRSAKIKKKYFIFQTFFGKFYNYLQVRPHPLVDDRRGAGEVQEVPGGATVRLETCFRKRKKNALKFFLFPFVGNATRKAQGNKVSACIFRVHHIERQKKMDRASYIPGEE